MRSIYYIKYLTVIKGFLYFILNRKLRNENSNLNFSMSKYGFRYYIKSNLI